jgi:hypothetical protein
MKYLLLLLSIILVGGCATMDKFIEKGDLNVYSGTFTGKSSYNCIPAKSSKDDDFAHVRTAGLCQDWVEQKGGVDDLKVNTKIIIPKFKGEEITGTITYDFNEIYLLNSKRDKKGQKFSCTKKIKSNQINNNMMQMFVVFNVEEVKYTFTHHDHKGITLLYEKPMVVYESSYKGPDSFQGKNHDKGSRFKHLLSFSNAFPPFLKDNAEWAPDRIESKIYLAGNDSYDQIEYPDIHLMASYLCSKGTYNISYVKGSPEGNPSFKTKFMSYLMKWYDISSVKSEVQ